jgi:hypothetical protein
VKNADALKKAAVTHHRREKPKAGKNDAARKKLL